MTLTDAATTLARAIAHAEGYYVQDSLPQRANNPGDLELGDRGYGVINKKTVYGSPEEGWAQLEHQCVLIIGGIDRYYKNTWTVLQIAETYTGHDSAASWAKAVQENLGISATAPISVLLDPLWKPQWDTTPTPTT